MPTNVQSALKADETVPTSAAISLAKAKQTEADVCMIAPASATGFDVRR
jgi:hypothetical protein